MHHEHFQHGVISLKNNNKIMVDFYRLKLKDWIWDLYRFEYKT